MILWLKFSSELANYMLKQKHSVREAAQATGLTTNLIWHAMKGNRMSAMEFMRLCDYMGKRPQRYWEPYVAKKEDAK